MRNIFEYKFPEKPVLIIGKGPSYQRREHVNEEKYFTIGINQVPHVDLAHFIDWEVFDFNRPAICCPYYPLMHRSAGNIKCPEHDFIWAYNFYTHKPVGVTPVIKNDQFSLHCILQILALKGIKKVYTLGIDGGSNYADNFDEKFKRPEGYDKQFKMTEQIKMKYGMQIHAV